MCSSDCKCYAGAKNETKKLWDEYGLTGLEEYGRTVSDTKYDIQSKQNFEKLKLNAHILTVIFNEEEFKFISTIPDHFKIFLKKNELRDINIKNI